MKKILAFFELFRFKWMYSKRQEATLRCIVFGVFVWSLIGLCADATGLARHGVAFAVGLLVSGFSILKDIIGFSAQFKSRCALIRFKDRMRNEQLDIVKRWEGMKCDASGFSIYKIVDGNGAFVDFYSCSKDINLRLANGLEIQCRVVNSRETAFWKKINANLDEALLFLALKQRANRYENFRNETKIAIVSPLALLEGNSKTLEICVAKTCYYASYLTNEFYRDCAYDGVDISNRLKGSDNWDPYEKSNLSLPPFDAADSFHAGVNTLGITLDGHVCLWRQKQGNYSRGLVAPTGSGSMDWSDMAHMRGAEFDDAVKFGAERELREESFSRETQQKLVACGKKLESRIIGLFRWGSRGGLPGFVLTTLIPLRYRDIVLRGRNAFGEGAECMLDTARLDLDISPATILGDGLVEAIAWRKKAIDAIAAFQKTHSDELSVPLYACFDFLQAALDLSPAFATWLFKFVCENPGVMRKA